MEMEVENRTRLSWDWQMMCLWQNKQTNMKLLCSQLKGNCFPRNLSLTVFCVRCKSLCHCAHFSVMSLTQCIAQRQSRQLCVHLTQYNFQRNIADTVLFSAISCRFARKFTSDFSHQHSFQISCSILSRKLSWSIAIAELATDVMRAVRTDTLTGCIWETSEYCLSYNGITAPV